MIKASAIAELPEVRAMDAIVLADDSGLEIDYLNKEPGIYSARYAGTNTSYDIKNSLLLSRMKGVPDKQRTARFVCAVAAVFPQVLLREVGDAQGGDDECADDFAVALVRRPHDLALLHLGIRHEELLWESEPALASGRRT